LRGIEEKRTIAINIKTLTPSLINDLNEQYNKNIVLQKIRQVERHETIVNFVFFYTSKKLDK
jgi:hypothetical protein